MSGDAMFCEHANENPSSFVCRCPPECYCWTHTCRLKQPAMPRAEAERRVREILRAGEEMDEDLALLRWAGVRPGVLNLLRALRDANYDETGTEYLRRIVDGRGIGGERQVGIEQTKDGKCANCGRTWELGKHVARGTGYCEVEV